MRHEQFAEQASKALDEIAASLKEDDPRIGCGITSMRANELRVAALVVRDLSDAVSRREKHTSSAKQTAPQGASMIPVICSPKEGARGTGLEVKPCR
jgi:hypothetical protein